MSSGRAQLVVGKKHCPASAGLTWQGHGHCLSGLMLPPAQGSLQHQTCWSKGEMNARSGCRYGQQTCKACRTVTPCLATCVVEISSCRDLNNMPHPRSCQVMADHTRGKVSVQMKQELQNSREPKPKQRLESKASREQNIWADHRLLFAALTYSQLAW